VRQLRQADLRASVALVTQQAVLFEGTLLSNLLYAAPAASQQEVLEVLHAVDLADLVRSLPDGLQTRVGEGGLTLSGGPRQPLALARALLTHPAVLLLDDCTSALDAETEAKVWSALDRVAPRCTRVVVSHKPTSFSRADWLVVLEAGRIVKQGRPDDVQAE